MGRSRRLLTLVFRSAILICDRWRSQLGAGGPRLHPQESAKMVWQWAERVWGEGGRKEGERNLEPIIARMRKEASEPEEENPQ